MRFQENVDLANFSTMALGGKVRYLVRVSNETELVEAMSFAKANKLHSIIIGEGSNIVWQDGLFEGLVIVNDINYFDIHKETSNSYLLTVGAGEIWDKIVEQSTSEELSGIEALSLIPGKTGATPIQNVGAYGQEISQSLVNIRVYDALENKFFTIDNADCGFGYRTSRFKTSERGRFYITKLKLRLKKTNPEPPFYKDVTNYFNDQKITDFTPETVRQAVIQIRKHKLPDPKTIHNCGSFFANPLISQESEQQLKTLFPDLVSWPTDNGLFKVSAAWLIEKAGYKNYHDQETGMATWENQPLVLVNEHAKSTNDLLLFKEKIVSVVQARFGIELQQEPELLP